MAGKYQKQSLRLKKLVRKNKEYFKSMVTDKEIKWTRSIVIRYALLQLPAIIIFTLLYWLVNQYFQMPVWLFWVILAGWIIKDILLFPFVWKSYDTRDKDKYAVLTGKTGTVIELPNPIGTVLINGEIWRGRLADPGVLVKKGEKVAVTGQEKRLLIIDKIMEDQYK